MTKKGKGKKKERGRENADVKEKGREEEKVGIQETEEIFKMKEMLRGEMIYHFMN